MVHIYMGVSVYWPKSVLYVFVCLYVSVCVCVRSNKSSGKKPHYKSDLSKLTVCTSPPFLLGGSVSYQIFKKGGGGLTGSQFLEGGCWERGAWLFSGGCSFYNKKNRYEIFNNKKKFMNKNVFLTQLRI